MEQKHLFMSALGVGLGVGVGFGLASGQTVSKWTLGSASSNATTAEQVEQELLRQVVEGRDSKVTFDEFPYYLSEQTRVLLTSAAYVHLKQADFSKYTRNLSPASRAILLSGPAELYQQMLAKALAHYFETKLLLLDVTDFSLKVQSKYGSLSKESSFKRSISETTLERMSSLLGSFSILPPREENKGSLRRQSSGVDIRSRVSEGGNNISKLRRNASAAADISSLASQSPPTNPAPLKRTSSWSFDEKLLLQSLYKVLVSVSKKGPIVLYIRDVESLLFRSQRTYSLFQKMLKKLSGPVLILGSRIPDPDDDCGEVDERLSLLFPYNIEIRPPEDETHLVSWKSQLEEDMKMIQYQDNRIHITEVLAANDLDCDDLGSVCLADAAVFSNYIEEIVVSAVSYHLMNNKDPEYRNGKLVISSKSLAHGLSIFQENGDTGKDTLKLEDSVGSAKEPEEPVTAKSETKSEAPSTENKGEAEKSVPAVKKDGGNSSAPTKEVAPDNEFEKRIRPEVIPANEIGVTFTDIGALDDIKESLQELVMLPLRRPDLFKGGLLKPCRGILLFGPPGTGKTMLAKAIANEAGASFINVSMSTITSKWFGEDEKNVRALFTLAAKVSPTIIFVDEVDSMLGERILVLAATNRPFDLDEAIIRRFERRIMVGLPSVENREMILKTLLAKEKVEEGLDFKELAMMTEGYSGSDLKNLCTTAAYRPVRELIQKERLKDLEKKQKAAEREKSGESVDTKEEVVEEITLRPLSMQDMRLSKNQVAASFSAEGTVMSELKQWNESYGEGEMATEREKERDAELESATYTNCLLLGLDPSILGATAGNPVPRSGLFRHSNPRLGEQLLYFLLCSLRGPAQSSKDFDKVWPIFDSAQSRDFRKIVHGIISELESQGALPRSNSRVSSLATCCGPRFVELLWQLSVHALREVHRRLFPEDVASNPLPASLTDVSYTHAATLLPVTKAFLQQELEKLQDLRSKEKLEGDLWDDRVSNSLGQNSHLVSKATRLWDSLLARQNQHEVLASGPIEDLIAHREHRYRISGTSLLAAMDQTSQVSYKPGDLVPTPADDQDKIAGSFNTVSREGSRNSLDSTTTQGNDESLNRAKANDGEGPELLRGAGGHAESLDATLSEHRQHLASIQDLIDKLKESVPEMQQSISKLTEEVNQTSSVIPLPKHNGRSTLSTQAQSSGRTTENSANEVVDVTSRLSSVQLETVSTSPALKLPQLFSVPPGKAANTQKKLTGVLQANQETNLPRGKSFNPNDHVENPIQDSDSFYAQSLKRSVREAALSKHQLPNGLIEGVSDNRASYKQLNHWSVPNENGDQVNEVSPSNLSIDHVASNSQRLFYDIGEMQDHVFSPPLLMDSPFTTDAYEDLLAPLSETDAALMIRQADDLHV
ncbi:Katanin p60 ATPase-containing subunit A1 [Acorus gramineus]|uniref:Katanin p60 ATPase-containing subunit A1 n=1 Tax=Acorus gramineus TaxID=55184 RepID=A0AAV9BI62_ACOGR|nr:Katanin p60 ATPase-containing subunit A1 [Acorus gramineus]